MLAAGGDKHLMVILNRTDTSKWDKWKFVTYFAAVSLGRRS
jgi:translation elongation factor EF-1alpha